ncbi:MULTISPECIES: energy-coupling factor transporter transmembrane component T [unclassified Paenibacillus]|uniref:Energy-coupling factor transporter transmembrane component T family protein n=1 Tax=Paenibacillus provencensis TaxID=441151 RepID=A0ABW3Q1K8_9BACL|nr:MULTISPECIES: energy-coupling factor transporter transmembrane component T [unclassified Paenibacillus]MCM3129461.1 energy-coupling factor transporter transmembrane protein EcfT [Paenibacillus sp. MER 78]SFS73497.1 energy-coupling factor transport system permease protein [Paenibacillus sp. 453mf]
MLLQYRRGTSLLHQISPMSKLVMLAAWTVAVLNSEHLLVQGLMFLILLAVGRLGAGLPFSQLRKAVFFVLSFGLPYFVLTTLAVPGKETLWELGPIHIAEDSMLLAGALSLRMFNLFLSSLLFITTTDPRDFVHSLTLRLKVPYRFAFGVSIALTFLPLLEEEGRVIAQAHKVRGSEARAGISNKLRYYRNYGVSILVNCIRRVQQTAGAMEAKGFGAYPERTYLRVRVFSRYGPWMAGGSVLLLVLIGVMGEVK